MGRKIVSARRLHTGMRMSTWQSIFDYLQMDVPNVLTLFAYIRPRHNHGPTRFHSGNGMEGDILIVMTGEVGISSIHEEKKRQGKVKIAASIFEDEIGPVFIGT